MTKKQNPPRPSINHSHWEEILSDINYDFLPLEYVSTIIVKFLDGKVWEVGVDQRSGMSDDPGEVINEFLKEYEDNIETVDFRLDTDRLKKDVSRRTRRFLKLNK